MPIIDDPRYTQSAIIGPVNSALFEQDPELVWKRCVDDVTAKDPDLDLELAEGVCRDVLHRPWYDHTPYESAMHWLDRHEYAMLSVVALVIAFSIAWPMRRRLNTAS
jgi:hypothetical protein